MNANNAVNTSTQKAYSAPVNHPLDSLPKAYGAGGPQTKQLGGDPALAQWYQEATAWYQAAISGQIQANPADIQQVASYLQWAAQQMGMGPQWDPMGGQGMYGQSAMPQEMHYDYESNEITTTGGEVTHRSWGLDDTLTVPSMAADVEYIWTTDDTVSPPKKVLKVIITNEITGAKEVAIFENADDPDFKLTIKSPKPDTQIHGTAPGINISTATYNMTSEKSGNNQQASIPGEVNESGEIEYVDQDGTTVDFWPQGNPDDPTTSVVWADANIIVPGGGTANAHMDGDELVVEVRDRDGNLTDTYRIQKGYNAKIQIKEEYLNINGQPYEDVGIGAEFDDRLSIGGGASDIEGSAQSGDAQSIIDELLGETERTEGQLLSALKTAGFDFKNVEDFKKALASGDFPGEDNFFKFFKFLRELDPELYDLSQEIEHDLANGKTVDDVKSQVEAYGERLFELVDIFYKNKDEIAHNDGMNTPITGQISIGGETYVWAPFEFSFSF